MTPTRPFSASPWVSVRMVSYMIGSYRWRRGQKKVERPPWTMRSMTPLPSGHGCPRGHRRRIANDNGRASRRAGHGRAASSHRRRSRRSRSGGSPAPVSPAWPPIPFRRAPRVDAGDVERLAGVDVAQPRDDPLVEEERLDRPDAPGELGLEVRRGQAGPERLGAERGEGA